VILDDDGIVLSVASQLLRDAGFDVATYAGRMDRLNFIADHKPDLILIDVNMPFLQGNQLVDLMKQDSHFQQIPVVFLSSHPAQELRRLVADTGAQGFLEKAELDANFSGKVARILDQSVAATAALH
jgi:CheY-like chemotaxis protein